MQKISLIHKGYGKKIQTGLCVFFNLQYIYFGKICFVVWKSFREEKSLKKSSQKDKILVKKLRFS